VDFGWRISDELSMSSFDAFKRRYASGDYIFVFDVIVNLLKKYHLLTSPRKKTIKKEVIRLGVQVRLNGGRAALVTKALLIAKDAGALTPVEFIELKIVFSLWFRVLGKIPAMSYLARRFKVQEVHGS
jgi:hypothetical protein